jgi:hypothetical protein
MPSDTRKRRLAILGAVILLATYVSKEIVQSHFEDRLRQVESAELELRLGEQFERLSPNLRSELASGTDLRKALQGKPDIAAVREFHFYFLVEMECDKGGFMHPSNVLDQSCAANEWIRQSDYEKRRYEGLKRVAAIIGEPPHDHSKDDVEKALEEENRGYQQLTGKGADGSPLTPTKDQQRDYIGAASRLANEVDARALALGIREPEVVGRLHLGLTIATISAALLYFAGWLLTLYGTITGSPVNAASA